MKPKLPQLPALPDFLEDNRPKHDHLEQMQEMAQGEDRAQAFKDFLGHFVAATEPVKKPETLIDMYLQGDMSKLVQDALARPDHYDQRQHEIITALSRDLELDTPATVDERNELFITFMRDTEAQKKTKERNQRLSDSGGSGIVLEDGRTLEEAAADERKAPTFENQDYKVII